ncbi:MAG: hypothetical protein WC325_10720 [Candidatus Bathyarchaeia archaeon]|jgi:hypothetical protein
MAKLEVVGLTPRASVWLRANRELLKEAIQQVLTAKAAEKDLIDETEFSVNMVP